MADKFLDAVDLEKVKEEIAMTRLGQMIWNDGKEEGIAESKRHLIKVKLEKGKTLSEIAADLEDSEENIVKIIEEIKVK